MMLKLQYFDHLMPRADSSEKSLMMERLRAGEEGDNKGWDGWMASRTQWTWIWATPGDSGGPGSLACCSPWGCKESDTIYWLNNNSTYRKAHIMIIFACVLICNMKWQMFGVRRRNEANIGMLRCKPWKGLLLTMWSWTKRSRSSSLAVEYLLCLAQQETDADWLNSSKQGNRRFGNVLNKTFSSWLRNIYIFFLNRFLFS